MLFICSLLAFSMNAVEANKKKQKTKTPSQPAKPQSTKSTKKGEKQCQVTYSYKQDLEESLFEVLIQIF